MAFGFANVKLQVIDIGYQKTCSGMVCRGQYGANGCPCVTTSTMPASAIATKFIVRHEDDTDLCQRYGLKLEPFISYAFSDLFVDRKLLEVRITSLC